MPIEVTAAVLCAALFHAIWNGIIKGGKDPLLASMTLCIVWFFICIPLMIVLPLPHVNSWPYALAAIIIHNSYFFLLVKSYQIGDFGAVYPIVRGLPPLIVTLISVFIIGESVSFYGAIGVTLIGVGILTLEIGNRYRSYKLLGFAFATALMIAAYTVIDGIGARVSKHSTSFFAWFSFFQAITFISIVFFLRSKSECLHYVKQQWKFGITGGSLSFIAYAIVLWATTKSPIAYVSALRETSVLFASIIAVVFLGEKFKRSRIISAILIFCGICAVRWG